jgi:hypothetical protein
VKLVPFCRADVLNSWPRRPLGCSADATPMTRQVNRNLEMAVGSWQLGKEKAKAELLKT